MTWLRPVDRTSGTLTLSAGTLPCLAHHGTPLSERCPTTTAPEHTTVPMDNADRMPPLCAVKPRQKLFDDIHRGGSGFAALRNFRAGLTAAGSKTVAGQSGYRFDGDAGDGSDCGSNLPGRDR